MGDPNKIWAQGDDLELGARQLNSWTRGAQFAQQALGQPLTPGVSGPPQFLPLRVRNATGDDLPQFSVVTFAAPTQLPSDNLPQWSLNTTLDAIVPAAPLTRFAVLTTGLKANQVAENIAAIGGVVPCVITGSGSRAQAIDGDTAKLQAGSTGHEIIWQESGTGERKALIQIGTSGGCEQRYSLGMYNYPASGSGVIEVTYNAVTESIALPHDSTAAEIKALIDAHSEMALEPVECEVESAADWPHGIMLVKMPPGATLFRTGQALVRNTVAYLPEFRVDLCCT